MTMKQKKWLKVYQQTGNATEAAAQTYDVGSRRNAEVIGSKNLNKPEILAILQAADERAQSVIVKTMNQMDNPRLAFDAAKEIMDRVHGKAAQRTENVSASFIHHTSDKAKKYSIDT